MQTTIEKLRTTVANIDRLLAEGKEQPLGSFEITDEMALELNNLFDQLQACSPEEREAIKFETALEPNGHPVTTAPGIVRSRCKKLFALLNIIECGQRSLDADDTDVLFTTLQHLGETLATTKAATPMLTKLPDEVIMPVLIVEEPLPRRVADGLCIAMPQPTPEQSAYLQQVRAHDPIVRPGDPILQTTVGPGSDLVGHAWKER